MKVKSNNAGTCPVCNQDSALEYAEIEFDGDMCWFPWRCKECGAEGEEWYILTFTGHNVYNEEGDCIEITDDMIEEEK